MSIERHAQGIVIVGAGLVGSLVAILLARRGFEVTVYERGPDLRQVRGAAGRSINLVITSRGLDALERVGLRQSALDLTVSVTGRMIHALDGKQSYQPYGKDNSECNYSISRRGLNEFLVSQAEQQGVRFHFDRALQTAEPESGRLSFDDGTEIEAPIVLGADGAASPTRAALMDRPGNRESAELLDHGYKELVIPAELGPRIERHALHIWPRGDIMLMALPNLDPSFTLTLYMPFAGEHGFDHQDSAERVQRLFDEQFPDAVPLIPDLTELFLANPTGNLGTVKCSPWHHGGRMALIGDAAHAIVPFFGQGMNCGFEDCAVLDDLIEAHPRGDWERIFRAYDRSRKPNTDAIADMALENFVEMRDRVGDPRFLLRKQVEHRLEQSMPLDYRSRYSMVMYSSIPYRTALEAGELQREILDELCRDLASADDLDLDAARRLIRQKLTPYLQRNAVDLTY